MNAEKKTTSIVKKLNRRLQWRRFFAMLAGDIAIAIACIAGWCYATEKAIVTDWSPWLARSVSFIENTSWRQVLQSAQYCFTAPDGTPHVRFAGDFVFALACFLGILLVLQLVGWMLDWGAELNALRRAMTPIDELALAADKIVSSGFDPNKIRPLENALEQVRDPDARVHVADSDLTGLEAAVNNMLKRLEESAREQVRFVDDASHELRTPIAVIRGYADMLDRWGKDDPQVLHESIGAIQTETAHMQTLVEQLLFLARGDMGRQHLTLAPLELTELLREIYEESRMIDEAHAYKLEAGAPCTVQADAALLKQAVRILVDNAAKYTPPEGEILLRTLRNAAGEACLIVQDSGIGIAGGDAQHMFERFYRADAVRGKQGSGLGLSIADWIVDAHGGHIEVLSYQDLGTRISICLPAVSSVGSVVELP